MSKDMPVAVLPLKHLYLNGPLRAALNAGHATTQHLIWGGIVAVCLAACAGVNRVYQTYAPGPYLGCTVVTSLHV